MRAFRKTSGRQGATTTETGGHAAMSKQYNAREKRRRAKRQEKRKKKETQAKTGKR